MSSNAIPTGVDQAIELLKSSGCTADVIEHSQAVSEYALEIAQKISYANHIVDVDFIRMAALLHDIGRCRTHGIRHGIEGADILSKKYPGIALVCERHLGAGISEIEAADLGLPKKDYTPESLEEKIIAHADNLVFGTKRVSIEESLSRMEKRIGEGHPALARMRALADEIVGLM